MDSRDLIFWIITAAGFMYFSRKYGETPAQEQEYEQSQEVYNESILVDLLAKMSSDDAQILGYSDLIWKWGNYYRVDPAVIAGVIWQESKGLYSAARWEARVRMYSYGLMQILPTTAMDMGWAGNETTGSRLLDPDLNINMGAAYLSNRISEFGGIVNGISAYNAGHVDNPYSNPAYVANVLEASRRFRGYFKRLYSNYLSLFPDSRWKI